MNLPPATAVWNRAALEDGGSAPREGDRALAGLDEEEREALTESYVALIPSDSSLAEAFEQVYQSSPQMFVPPPL
jgi:hypothetical protein